MVHAAVELDVPDLIANGRTSLEALSAATGIDASRLGRLLRGLVALGVLVERESGFATTDVGEMFRRGVPGSRRAMTRMLVPESYQPWSHFLEALRTGVTGESLAYGGTLWEHIARDPDFAARFNEAMVANSETVADFVARTADFSGASLAVDVGGGTGALIASVLLAHDHLRGIVFDLPAGLARTAAYLATRGLSDRCSVVEGDFFTSMPAADLYLLKDILHDWDDDHAAQILRVSRSAMNPGGRMIIVERVMPSTVTDEPAHVASTMTDLHMMVLLGGHERTLEEYSALFKGAGLALKRFIPGELFHIVEAVGVQ